MKSLHRFLYALGLLLALASSGLVHAQSEPTMAQIYATAQAGKLDEAQVMVQQVLVSHPQSAKAFFVQAELYARQGKTVRAGESLAAAERIAPGLPFAKPEAVGALRAQLARSAAHATTSSPGASYAAGVPAPRESSASWLMPLLLAVGVIAAGYFFFRRRNPEPQMPAYTRGGLDGPQTFGAGGANLQPVAPQGGYPGAYPQSAGSGLGGRIMGGVATGLAVGAGVMAAEAIGRNLMGGHTNPSASPDAWQDASAQFPVANGDMGGDNFGITESTWDDGGAAGGAGDWDN